MERLQAIWRRYFVSIYLVFLESGRLYFFMRDIEKNDAEITFDIVLTNIRIS